MTVFLLILGIVLFIGLVVVHELGHFLVARKNGVEAEEFGIGFPPRIWKKRVKSDKGDFDFTINLLPLGGFVKLKGEHDNDTGKGTFGAANLKVKTKIMLAGVVMNLVVALVMFTVLALVGMPKLITKDSGVVNEDQFSIKSDEHLQKRQVLIADIEEKSPAAQAGLQPLDQLEAIGPVGGPLHTIEYVDQLPGRTHELAGKQVTVEYRRHNKLLTTTTTLRTAAEVDASKNSAGQPTKGYLGVVPTMYEAYRYTWSAPVVAVGLSAQITKLTFQALGNAVAGLGKAIAGFVTLNHQARVNGQTAASQDVSGPVGIFFVLKAGAQQGIVMVLFIVALISLTLAIMNVLPIPALDGGRLFLTLIFRAIKKPLTQGIEETIVGASFAILMLLFVLITVVDFKRFM